MRPGKKATVTEDQASTDQTIHLARAESETFIVTVSSLSPCFGHRRRCAGDDNVDSGLCIPLEVAQVEVVGSQFHLTCQAHLISKVWRGRIFAHARQHLRVGGQRPIRVKRDHEGHALTAVCVEQRWVLDVRSKRHGPHRFGPAGLQDPGADGIELFFVLRRIDRGAADGKGIGTSSDTVNVAEDEIDRALTKRGIRRQDGVLHTALFRRRERPPGFDSAFDLPGGLMGRRA